MPSNYEELQQHYQGLLSSFSHHKREVSCLFEQFLKSLEDYLGCSNKKIHLINRKGQIVTEVMNAAHLNNELLPWTLWFAIEFERNIEIPHLTLPVTAGKFGIRIHTWREEKGWNIRLAGFDQDFHIPVNQQEPGVSPSLDSFNELNKFIHEKSQEYLQSYFDRFLNHGRQVENKRDFGFIITQTEEVR